MKILNKIAAVAVVAMSMTTAGCTDWLTEPQPDVTNLEDFYISATAATQNVTACYVPLQWEFGGTYFSEWFVGDVMSDDALKGGGSINDMADAGDMEMWQTQIDNTLVRDLWRSNFLGVSRCNLALANIATMKTDTAFSADLKNRLLGEAHFLRAYYYFRLVREFGGVPLVDHVIESDKEWNIPRSSAKDVYAFILKDLEFAQKNLWKKSKYASEDLGRATKGAAEAMLMKVNLYLASDGNAASRDESMSQAAYYQAAKNWGDSLFAEGEYSLCPQYADNFTLEGENGQESIFEIQYIGNEGDGTGDYGDGDHYGFTRGTFTPVLVRSRSSVINTLGDGWGFNHPSRNLYNEFEAGDIRRDVSIYEPKAEEIVSENEESYLGNTLLNRKYGIYNTVYTAADAQTCVTIYQLKHPTRGPINNKQIRLADAYLMYAEACLGLNDASTAATYINKVRGRVGLTDIATADWKSLRHERRCELAMEGHRWFDLCRWGIAYETMTAYEQTETEAYKTILARGGGFIKGKHELLPIPLKEIELDGALRGDQNPGY